MRQSGGSTSSLAHAPGFLMLGCSAGVPYWRQPTALVRRMDHDLMHRPGARMRSLRPPIVNRGAVPAQRFAVESHAPTPTPEAIVRLDKTSEVVSGIGGTVGGCRTGRDRLPSPHDAHPRQGPEGPFARRFGSADVGNSACHQAELVAVWVGQGHGVVLSGLKLSSAEGDESVDLR
jgi:hypothetical protein